MTRIHPLRSLAAAAALAFVAAVAAVASPAAAWTDPAELTVTPVSGSETSNVIFRGECPAGSDHADISWVDPSTSGTSTVTRPLDLTGEFSTSPSAYATGGGRGDTVVFTITCRDTAEAVVGGTGTASFTHPDLGSRWLSVPAVLTAGTDLTVSYDCGAATLAGWALTSANIQVFDAGDNLVTARSAQAVPTASVTFAASEFAALAPGQLLTLALVCVGDDGLAAPATLSARYVATELRAATTTPPTTGGGGTPPGTPSGASQPTLAETGPEQALRTALLALVLLIAGGVLLARRDPAAG